jgi:plastocyanin
MTHTLRLITASLALALVAAACGSSSSSPAPAKAAATTSASVAKPGGSSPASARPISGHTTVKIRSYMYSPMHLTVTAGTKVSFHNYDQTAHTATAIDHSFDSGTIQPGKTSTVTFTKAGTYKYHCLFHQFMTATITVLAKG